MNEMTGGKPNFYQQSSPSIIFWLTQKYVSFYLKKI
jgi:hypothetical protein